MATTDTGCALPIKTFAYPINQVSPVKNYNDLKEIYPTTPWHIEASLPELPEGTKSYEATIITRTPKNGKSEIWVERNWGYIGEKADGIVKHSLLIYRTDKKQWITFQDQIVGSNVKIYNLYQLKYGVLWADGYSNGSDNNPKAKHVLGSYNEKAGQFELVKYGADIPNGRMLLDPKGIFWILKPWDGIYSFDPITGKTMRHVSIPDLWMRTGDETIPTVLASDGSIYFVKAGETESELSHFFPATNILDRNIDVLITHEEYLQSYDSIFMDHSGRLWFNDLGWLESDGIWYQIIRSTNFITDREPDSGRHYIWPYARIVFESSDGMLWFRSINGMTRLDPQKGDWCWFTTAVTNIVEDQQHNLWMTAGGNLYKYPLKP